MDYLNERKTGGQQMPDLILLDLNMPRKNGHEVLADVQADKELSKIPVVLLTVSQRDEDVLEALKLEDELLPRQASCTDAEFDCSSEVDL